MDRSAQFIMVFTTEQEVSESILRGIVVLAVEFLMSYYCHQAHGLAAAVTWVSTTSTGLYIAKLLFDFLTEIHEALSVLLIYSHWSPFQPQSFKRPQTCANLHNPSRSTSPSEYLAATSTGSRYTFFARERFAARLAISSSIMYRGSFVPDQY